jgi:hypothetical protein
VFNQQVKGDVVPDRTPEVAYEKPAIVDYGDLVELTAAGGGGDCLDHDFSAGAKASSLTFSGC